MDIALYISNLFHEHDEVNLPGLGTFFQKRVNGFYDPKTKLFVPPSQCLDFKLEQNESLLLADYCCTQRNISRTTALYFIEKFVKTIWTQLSKSGIAELKSLGTLRKIDGGYTFEAIDDNAYGKAYYGLTPISERPENIIEEKSEEPHPLETISESVNQVEYSSIIEEVDHPVDKSKSLTEAILTLVVLLLFIVTSINYFYPNIYTKVNDLFPAVEQQLLSEPQAPESEYVAADSIVKHQDTTFDTLQVASSSVNDTTHAQSTIQSNQISYEVIGASFRKQSEAERHLFQLKTKGVEARIIAPTPNGSQWIRISYGSFIDKKEAQKELVRIKKEIDPAAWMDIIYPQKIK